MRGESITSDLDMGTNGKFKSPGFIVGKGRSGTTLLAAILNRNKVLCVTPETNFMYMLSKYPGGAEGFEKDWPKSLFSIVGRMVPTEKVDNPAQIVYEKVEGAVTSAKDTFLLLGKMFAEMQGKELWIEKTPDHVYCLPFIRRMFPECPIINIIRDGRDVAHSLTKVPFGSKNYYENLYEWKAAIKEADDFELVHNNVKTVKYEDLVNNPKEIIEKICEFLGVDYEEEMLTPDGNEKSLFEKNTEHKAQVSKPIDTGKVGIWKANLSPRRAKAATMIAFDELKIGGYLGKEESPSANVIVSKSLLVSRDNREIYDQILECLADKIKNGRLQSINAPGELPVHQSTDYWIFNEVSLPRGSMGRLGGGWQLLKIMYQIMWSRLVGTKLIWVTKTMAKDQKRWWIYEILEYVLYLSAYKVIILGAVLDEQLEIGSERQVEGLEKRFMKKVIYIRKNDIGESLI